jgi:hypothetical protein
MHDAACMLDAGMQGGPFHLTPVVIMRRQLRWQRLHDTVTPAIVYG